MTTTAFAVTKGSALFNRSMEEFADIPGWPGYRVSKTGEVISCRTNAGKCGDAWKMLRLREDQDGYFRIGLHCNGKNVFIGVHSLVLMAWVGPKPDGCVVLHANGVRSDNRLKNLSWGTPQANADDRDSHGNTARHEKNGNASIGLSEVGYIRRMRAYGLSFSNIGWIIGLSKRQVMRICNNVNWRGIDES